MEMYKEKLIVAIKHNGKILRENKDLVTLPYGSEFTVLVKNLNSKRAKFTLHIDGADVLDGEEIIVNGNSEVEMKRFIRNGNMAEGNAFKFIERTKSIEDGPRGIKVDDGIVRLEVWFEQDRAEIKINDIYWDNHHYRDYYVQPRWPTFGGYPPGTIFGSVGASGASGSIATDNSPLRGMMNNVTMANNVTAQSTTFSTSDASATTNATTGQIFADKCEIPVNDAGITVAGSKVEQKFTPVYGFKSELNSHIIILRMIGMIGTVEVVAPITVATKQKCSTCGKINKATSSFCSGCGTSLTLL